MNKGKYNPGRPPTFENGQDIRDRAFEYACCCRESWTRMRVCERRRIGPQPEARELVQERNELISIVTAIVNNKRKSVAARRAAEKESKAAAKQTRKSRPASASGEAASARARIPNS